MHPQPARDAREERAKRKGQHTGARHPDAKAGGGQFVLADRQHGPAQRGMLQLPADIDRQHDKKVDPPQRGLRRQPAQAQSPPRDPRQVHRKALHDEDQAQRCDGKVMAAQPQHRKARDHGGGGGQQPAGQQRRQKRPLLRHQHLRQRLQHDGLAFGRHHEDRSQIAADRHEGRMAQRKQADEAVGEVQTDGKDDVDTGKARDRQRVGVEGSCSTPDQRGTRQQRQGRAQRDRDAGHARVSVLRPNRPFGRTSSTTISAPNTKALR